MICRNLKIVLISVIIFSVFLVPCFVSSAVYYDSDESVLNAMGLGGGKFVDCTISGTLLNGRALILIPSNQSNYFTYDGSYNLVNTSSSTVNVRVYDVQRDNLYFGRFQSFGTLEVRSNDQYYTYVSERISNISDMNFKLIGNDLDLVAQNIFWNDDDHKYLLFYIFGLTLFLCLFGGVVLVRRR